MNFFVTKGIFSIKNNFLKRSNIGTKTISEIKISSSKIINEKIFSNHES